MAVAPCARRLLPSDPPPGQDSIETAAAPRASEEACQTPWSPVSVTSDRFFVRDLVGGLPCRPGDWKRRGRATPDSAAMIVAATKSGGGPRGMDWFGLGSEIGGGL